MFHDVLSVLLVMVCYSFVVFAAPPEVRARPRERADLQEARAVLGAGIGWLRTNGVNTNGAAAKAMNFDRLGKKVHPGTFGKIKAG